MVVPPSLVLRISFKSTLSLFSETEHVAVVVPDADVTDVLSEDIVEEELTGRMRGVTTEDEDDEDDCLPLPWLPLLPFPGPWCSSTSMASILTPELLEELFPEDELNE